MRAEVKLLGEYVGTSKLTLEDLKPWVGQRKWLIQRYVKNEAVPMVPVVSAVPEFPPKIALNSPTTQSCQFKSLRRWRGIVDGEELGLRTVADGAWRPGLSWFDAHSGALLSEVYPGFFKLWSDLLWHKPLKDALYWYLGACDRRIGIGVDPGLILAQTALELLAWTYCVLDRKMISKAAFQPRRLSAADKFRLLASSLDIPLAIPQTLKTLHSRRGAKWLDGMEAITDIRNALVHPSANRRFLSATYYEAWQLCLWYIDLVILRLCGHDGIYANRLQHRWPGEVERVPWART